jgi:hypothetical protein
VWTFAVGVDAQCGQCGVDALDLLVYPVNINPERFRLVAPFESDQTKWGHLKCMNIGDPKDRRRYGLTTSFTSNEYGRKAVVEILDSLFHRYMQHPEAKSLGPDGKPCTPETRGLLGRSHIIAGKHRRIGKESERRWEEGDDLESLMYVPVEYGRAGRGPESHPSQRTTDPIDQNNRKPKTCQIRTRPPHPGENLPA